MKRVCFLIIASLSLCLAAFAENDASPDAQTASTTPAATTENTPAVSAPVSDEAAPIAQTSAEPETTPGNVTVDFKDADIQNVLRILSYKSGVNIVAGKDVTGSVTIRLVNVPWEKALDVVLKTYGYAYDRDDNIIRVTTLENLKREDLSTEVYTLDYAQAADVDKSVKDVLSDRGKSRADSRSNTLIVTDMPTTLQNVNKVVKRLDAQTPQVLIQSKVVEITLGKSDKLGIKWNARAAINGSARPTTLPFPATRRGFLHGYLPDGRAPQDTESSVGTSSSTSTTTVRDFPSRGNQPTFPVSDKDEFTFGSLDFTQFQAVLELIQQDNDAKVLSEPHVVTLNNQEAKILVGEVIAIPTFERNSTTGRMEITGYRDRDLGIRLSVTPQINVQNEIVVTVYPQITNLIGYDDLTTDIRAPRFSTREAKTQVRIKSGQTIAIGGLIKENSVKTTTKFPLLGDMPLLGKLFKHEDTNVEKTDLLFFITVNVVNDKTSTVPQGHKL